MAYKQLRITEIDCPFHMVTLFQPPRLTGPNQSMYGTKSRIFELPRGRKAHIDVQLIHGSKKALRKRAYPDTEGGVHSADTVFAYVIQDKQVGCGKARGKALDKPGKNILTGAFIADGLTPDKELQRLWELHNLPGQSDTYCAHQINEFLAPAQWRGLCPKKIKVGGWISGYQKTLAKHMNTSLARNIPDAILRSRWQVGNAIFSHMATHAYYDQEGKAQLTTSYVRSEADIISYVGGDDETGNYGSYGAKQNDQNWIYEKNHPNTSDPYDKLNRRSPIYQTVRTPSIVGRAYSWGDGIDGISHFGTTDGGYIPNRVGTRQFPADTTQATWIFDLFATGGAGIVTEYFPYLRKNPTEGNSDDIGGYCVDLWI